MGCIGILLYVVAGVCLYGIGFPILMTVIIIAGVIDLWSYGMMHNYATEAAKQRGDSEEAARFLKTNVSDLNSVPNYITAINMVGTLASVGFLIAAIVLRVVH